METPVPKRTRITEHSTAGSFEQDLRELLYKRLRLVFGLAFLLSLITNLFYAFGIEVAPMVETLFTPWVHQIYGVFSVVFGLAAIVMLYPGWNWRQLRVIDYVVISLALLVLLFLAAVFHPHLVPLFAAALLLFIHASFVPVPVTYQIGLAVTVVLGYPLASLLAYVAFPSIGECWADGSCLTGSAATTYLKFVFEGAFMLAILAVTSVFMTKALYNMRKKLHSAQRMGNYVIERELGEGGMGKVFVAEHALICRPTAVKVLKDDSSEMTAALARFEREVKLSATLTHPNTITIYDFGRTELGSFYYAMEYLEGLDLQDLVERFGPMPADRAVYLLAQVCGSLAEAHSRDIVHRDIKPSNIFLTHRGGLFDFIKVLDFGLAKETKDSDLAALTQTGVLFGTPLYMPPEMAYAEGTVDPRTDLYCLGGVAYWMLAGRPPFVPSTRMQAIIDNVNKVPDRPSQVSELPIPEALDDIVMKCLEKKPADRFQDAAELQAALRGVELDSPWTQVRARDWWSLNGPKDRRGAQLLATAQNIEGALDAVGPVIST